MRRIWCSGLAVLSLALPGIAQETTGEATTESEQEKAWSFEVGLDYASLYMFRGLNLLGEDQEVWTPRAIFTYGGFSAWYYGYIGKFDLFDDEGSLVGEGDYTETDLGLDYTFSWEQFWLTLGALTYQYTGEVESGLGYADTYEVYALAGWDVLLAPTLSYYQDVDAIEGGFLTFDVSHSFPTGESLSFDLSAQLGFDFGYNQPGDPEGGLDETDGDLNHFMAGLDVPWQVTDVLALHALVQRSISLDVADDLGQPDETIWTVGATAAW
jgi:hypothetical protein